MKRVSEVREGLSKSSVEGPTADEGGRGAANDDKPNRRELLSRGGRVALATAIVPAATPLVGYGSRRARPRAPSWRRLERALEGRLLRPGDRGYLKASAAENYRYADILPAGVAICAGPEDVRASIEWARDNGVRLAARSGGHSFGGYSRTKGLLIDLSGMKSATFRRGSGTLHVTGATDFQEIDAALKPHDMFIPAGQCPPVGLNGFTLGGGFGFYSRAHGLAVDQLLETEVVLASGRIVRASRSRHPDLFWACRGGGGGNFGINTSMTFALFPVGDVSVCTCEWTTDPDVVLREFQKLFLDTPRAFSLIVRITPPARNARVRTPMVTALGHYFGPSHELREILDPVIAAVRPSKQQFLDRDFWSARHYLADLPGPPHAYAERSRYVRGPMSEAGVAAVLDWASRWPSSHPSEEGRLDYWLWGGAMNAVPSAATAFVHRNALSLFAVSASWKPEERPGRVRPLVRWVNGTWDAVGRHATDFAYQNFIDPALDDWKHAYYGANLPRLRRVKRRYDPDDVFRFAQSIPT